MGPNVATQVVTLDGRTLDAFSRSADRFAIRELQEMIEFAICRDGGESRDVARLAIFFHLYLLLKLSRRLAPADRHDYETALQLLTMGLADLEPPDASMTAWLLRYRRLNDPLDVWARVETALARWGTDKTRDETQILAGWLAARELLSLALSERNAFRVLVSLRYYKRWISGPQSDTITKASLRRVVEHDLLAVATEFPEFVESEREEREFFEDWFLARFTPLKALRFSHSRRFGGWIALGAVWCVVLAMMVAYLCSPQSFGEHFAVMNETNVPMTAGVFFLVTLIVFAASPDVFRLLYPRLFGAAVLGWTMVVATVTTEAMNMVMRIGDAWYRVAALVALILWFFLYNEVFPAVGEKMASMLRALGLLLWSFVQVALVGLVAHWALKSLLTYKDKAQTAVEAAVPHAGPSNPLLFFGGCMVSLLIAVVLQLVWADRGMSATLSHNQTFDD